MKRNLHLYILRILVVFSIFGIAIGSTKAFDRPSSPNPDPEISTVVAMNRFNFEFFRQLSLSENDKSVFCSPFSMFVALSMTAEGMDDVSLEVMQKLLHLPEETRRHSELKALMGELNQEGQEFELAVANAIWPEKSADVAPEFKKLLEDVYRGFSTSLDYKGAAESSRKTINQWVEGKTNNRIQDLLPEGSITNLTRMVLTNAIFFKGDWQTAFLKKLTAKQSFKMLDGEESEVDLMFQPSDVGSLAYAEMDGAQVVRIPYVGESLSMVVLLPQIDDFMAFQERLNVDMWAEMRSSMNDRLVDLYLPKFKMNTGGSMKGVLSDMGMKSLFESVSMKRMLPKSNERLLISDVFHKAFVEVGEEGTEAAAATAVVVAAETSSAFDEPEPVITFRADHPFLFAIEHAPSGAILFMGRVMRPEKG